MFADPYAMTTPLKRRRPLSPAVELVERTTHWRVIGGRVYRDVVVRVGDELRLWSVPEVAA